MKSRYTLLAALMLLALCPGWALGQPDTEIEITLHSETVLEEKGRVQLRRILAAYDLEPWIFTRHVMIQSRVIPHSHPVLSLNTRYVNADDVEQLSTFVHEQIHWFAFNDSVATDQSIAALRQRYPEVPVGGPEGARSEFSTYLHLIVCWLELDALKHLVGEERARKVLSEVNHYTWIYEQVLDAEEGSAIRAILEKHGQIIQPDD